MPMLRAVKTRENLIQASTRLFLRHGLVATTVDMVCNEAGVTKGAFFHHFNSKEALCQACLKAWDDHVTRIDCSAPFMQNPDPVARLLESMDFYADALVSPSSPRACLAGMAAQEVSQTHPELRVLVDHCFTSAQSRFKSLLDQAFAQAETKADTHSLAMLWIAAIQGALLLYKAHGHDSVIRSSLAHVRSYITGLLLTSTTGHPPTLSPFSPPLSQTTSSPISEPKAHPRT